MDETYNVLGIKGHLVGYQHSEPRTVEIFQIDPNLSLDFSLSAEPRHFIDHISTQYCIEGVLGLNWILR